MRWEIRSRGPWTDPQTGRRRSSGLFRASWEDTLKLLSSEAGKLGGEHVIIAVDVLDGQIRRDGMLHTRAAVGHPGVVISFESRHGPLRYATDAYDQHWYATDAYDQHWSGTLPGWQAAGQRAGMAEGDRA